MKYLHHLPWQIKFGLFAPFLALTILCTAYGSRTYYEWRIRQAIEQALASFDPETTKFTLFAQDWLNGIETHQKTSAQLTAQQRQLVMQWMSSFRYEGTYGGGHTGAGPYLWLEFDSPYGTVSANGFASLETSHEIHKFLGIIYHDNFRKIFNRIEIFGFQDSRKNSFKYIAEFDTDSSLGDQLWEIVMEKPHWFFPPMNEQ